MFRPAISMFKAVGVAGPVAVWTALLVAAVPLPDVFTACTWNEYVVPGERSENTQACAVVSHAPVGAPVTTYFAIAEPPFDEGAVQLT